MNLQSFKDSMAKEIFGMTKSEAVDKGICIQCKKPDALKCCYSAAGRREYYITGMCEKCFDNLFNDSMHSICKEA